MRIGSTGSTLNQQIESSIHAAEGADASAALSPQSEAFAQEKPDEKKVIKMPSDEEIEKAVGEMNKKMVNAEAVFVHHDETGLSAVKIINKDTKEVIKEFPSEKSLDMLAKIWEMAGIIVDEKR